MRENPPNKNNPSNPLLKVAALDINRKKRADDSEGVIVNLTFKLSPDLIGYTIHKDGTPVTVRFGLALKSATLQIQIVDDCGNPASGLIKFKKVAFTKRLAAPLYMIEKTTTTRTRSRGSSLGAEAKASFDTHQSVGAGAKANACFDTKKTTESSNTRTIASESLNVTGTYAGNVIDWHICPVPEHEQFLVGEVFKKANGRIGEACVFSRYASKLNSSIVVNASVFVLMQNLEVQNIEFTDSEGDMISNRNLLGSQNSLLSLIPWTSGAKKSILKQIISKHLKEQGMQIEGAKVEICRAHT